MGVSKQYGEWLEIRNRPQCNFGNYDEMRVSGPSYNVNPDVYLKGQEARFYAQTLMGLEGVNMWKGYEFEDDARVLS